MKKLNILLNYLNTAQKNKKLLIKINNISRVELNLLKILQKRGLILSYEIINAGCTVFLKYSTRGPVIQNIKIFSKTNNKKYTQVFDIQNLTKRQPFNVFILSTPFGLLDEKTATKWNTGGELVAIIELI